MCTEHAAVNILTWDFFYTCVWFYRRVGVNFKTITFLCIIRSSHWLPRWKKVGQLLIMEPQPLTINHESNLGTARQNHRLSISRPGHCSKCQCFIHSRNTIGFCGVFVFLHRRQHHSGVCVQKLLYGVPHWVHLRLSAAGANSALCDSIKSQHSSRELKIGMTTLKLFY